MKDKMIVVLAICMLVGIILYFSIQSKEKQIQENEILKHQVDSVNTEMIILLERVDQRRVKDDSLKLIQQESIKQDSLLKIQDSKLKSKGNENKKQTLLLLDSVGNFDANQTIRFMSKWANGVPKSFDIRQ